MESQSGRNFENLFWLPKKIGGWGGLNLPHHRVGSATEILRVRGAPYISLPRSIFREFFKKVQNLTIFEGA